MIEFLENAYKSLEMYPDDCYYNSDGLIPYNIAKNRKINKKKTNMVTWKKIGLFCDDYMTPIFENTWPTILESANNGIIAANMIKNNDKHKIYYCLNIYPGHHAGFTKYGDYCFVNNAMACAYCLSSDYKVGILDLDYHAGNGTAEIIDHIKNNNIYCVSIHANPEIEYPFYEGYEDDYDNKNILNIPFNCDTSVKKYIEYVNKALQFLINNDIDHIIIAFGGDTYKNDPDTSELCRCGLEIDDYKKIGEIIKSELTKFKKNLKIIITQEGGYDLENIGDIIKSFLNGLE
jgi:acetoin utilization deacetylase AcuC-like enzyme